MSAERPVPAERRSTGFEVAVIGMAGRFPKARDLAAFWRNIRDGVECVSEFGDEALLAAGANPALLSHPKYVKAGAVLDDPDLFDAAFFGFTPRDAEILDPQHRFFLECAWEALEDAGYDPEAWKRPIGVFAGASRNNYMLLNLIGRDPEEVRGLTNILASDVDYLTTRVSYKLNLKGPSVDVQTACSTSLVAVHLACQNLLIGECDMALAGGVSLRVPQEVGYLYQEGGTFSPDGHCRAFDARAAGIVCANGVGIVVLKRLSDAVADGDTIRAVIKGSAINNDGSGKVGFTAPSVDGQAEVIRRALALAEVEPDSIGYVEAHGTGTLLGDPIEIAGLTRAFRGRTARKGFCAIGSLKASIGHADAAAGVGGLIKAVLALENGVLPPSLNFERPNPNIDFENSPFYVNTARRDWPRSERPRRAGVSSFGMGGTNAHVVLEEAPDAPAAAAARPWQLLVVSARTGAALESATVRLCEQLRDRPGLCAADVAGTLQAGRRRFPHRRYVVCRDLDDAAGALEALHPGRVVTGVEDARERAVAFMFPGQGAQHVNMGRELYEGEAAFRAEVDRCSDLLAPHLGRDLRPLLYPGASAETSAAEGLRQTALTQPALFVVEYALARLWMSWGIQPAAMIGHSIGEYVAACLAGVFSLEDALALVARRGRLMQDLPPGAMLAVRLPASELEGQLGPDVGLAALNEETATIVSGSQDGIARLEARLAARGVACQRLDVSHAFHSAMMDPILEAFAETVRGVERRAPRIPYVSNLTGTWVTDAQATDPACWARHLREPVRFADGLRELRAEPERLLLEVGPGRTLTGLAARQAGRDKRSLALSSMRHASESRSDVAGLLDTLGRLWLAGVGIDWKGVHPGGFRRVPVPTHPFERQRYWVDPAPKGRGAAPEATGKKPDIADWFYVPSWTRMPLPAPDGDVGAQGGWLLFDDGTGFGARLTRCLEQAGQPVVSVVAARQYAAASANRYSLNPEDPRDYARLVEALAAAGSLPSRIVHLWGLASPAPGDVGTETPGGDDRRGFQSLVYLARALGERTDGVRREIVVVASGAHDVTGREALAPHAATLLGPCKVVPQEYAQLACRSVDLDPAGAARDGGVGALTKELLGGIADHAVAYRGGHRWVQGYQPWRLPAAAGRTSRLREGGVYLITGGMGGVGLEVAEVLARAVRATLVLVGRSALPERSRWESWLETHDEANPLSLRIRKILALEELGSEVLPLVADVANPSELESAVAQAELRFGKLHGVVHAAGADKGVERIAEAGPLEVERQFRPRLQGAAALAQVLDGRPLDFCLLISSLSVVLGGLGSVAYTAAHVFLDAFAARHNRTSPTPWLSVNWDRWFTWREASSAPSAGERDYFMAPAEAQEALRRALSSDAPLQLVVSTGDLQARLERWVRLASAPETDAAEGRAVYARPELGEAYVAPRTHDERILAGIWREALGVETVGVNDDFFEMGGDSVLGLRIVAKANEAGLRLSGRQIFEHHTIAELAAAVAAAGPQPAPDRPAGWGGGATAFPAARLNQEQLAAILTQLDSREGQPK